jgi:hypothetical protein
MEETNYCGLCLQFIDEDTFLWEYCFIDDCGVHRVTLARENFKKNKDEYEKIKN